MKIKLVLLIVLPILVIAALFNGLVGKNDDQNWQILQYPTGTIEVIDSAGYYVKAFGTVWTYPRAVQESFGRDEDESIRTTFNDGGTAEVSTMVRYQTPTVEADRRKFHRDFSGNIQNANMSVRAHLQNCIKATGPLMSATENQASRKSEFTDVIATQLRQGIFEMRRVERDLVGQTDKDGKPITVVATEIITERNEDGTEGANPVIAETSPLKEYGITVLQFSTTEIEYDDRTKDQFDAKKESYLLAEKSKAQREQEVQAELMVKQKGLRELAEVTAKANVEKAQATIDAEKAKEVAETKALQEKIVAETQAEKQLEVAKLEKQTAETAAQKKLEVAKLERQAAEETAEQILVLAAAEEEKIRKAGAITEKERVLAEIAANRDVSISKNLSLIKTPNVVIGGSGGTGEGGTAEGTTDKLMNLLLLERAGLIKETTPAKR